jgi:hypothetical protein
MVSKAAKTDLILFEIGDSIDKVWKGRLIVYYNLAFIFQNVGDLVGALKFLYDAQFLLIK